MRILVYGGSFDPPHRAHLLMLDAAIRALRPDRVRVVPAYRSPLKPGAHASGERRLRMTELAVRDCLPASRRRLVKVDPFEIRRGRTTYTWETLGHLRRKHPGAELRFLVGADALAGLPSWKRPRELAGLCSFVAGRRRGAPPPAIPHGPGLPRVQVLPGSFPDISSTEVRCRLLTGESLAEALPRQVLEHIRRHSLYGLDLYERLRKALGRERFAHTVSVARQAADLARRHHMGCEQAALAGLLHDCGRVIPVSRMAAYARKHRLRIPYREETARQKPLLLHGHIGEDLARRRFGVSDPEVLRSIRNHALGSARMSALDRLVYTADACSSDRDFPQARLIRRAALADLAGGYREAVRRKIEHILETGRWLHPSGAIAWNGVIARP